MQKMLLLCQRLDSRRTFSTPLLPIGSSAIHSAFDAHKACTHQHSQRIVAGRHTQVSDIFFVGHDPINTLNTTNTLVIQVSAAPGYDTNSYSQAQAWKVSSFNHLQKSFQGVRTKRSAPLHAFDRFKIPVAPSSPISVAQTTKKE